MKKDTKTAIKLGAIVLVTILIGFGLYYSDRNQKIVQANKIFEAKRSTQIFKTNEQGVRYFETCINNFKMIGTPSTQNYIQLAGPVGKCND